MKILYHHRTQGKGAEGVHIKEIIKAFIKSGHNVQIISPKETDPFQKNVFKEPTQSWTSYFWKNISSHAPQILFELMELAYNFAILPRLLTVLKKENYAFIYERYAFFCWITSYIAKKYNIPIFIEVNEVAGIKRARGLLLTSMAKSIERYKFRTADAIIVVSKFLKEHIESLGIDSNKIYIIPNGVDIDNFTLRQAASDELKAKYQLNGKTVIGFVGSFIKWHNFELLLNTFSKVVQETKTNNLCLFLIGDGPLLKSLKNQVVDNGIVDNVIFTGNIPHNIIPDYISTMDICVIPHTNEFRSPIKLFEYMAMGKPVIAPKVEPVECVITHNLNGSLFEPGNPFSFMKELKSLINNKKSALALGENAKKTIIEKYQWEHNVQTILQIHTKLKKMRHK